MKSDKVKVAYKQCKDFYDDALTRNKLWSKLYIDIFWGVDDVELADEILSLIPDDFNGKLLDVPVGTGVFTAEKYMKIKNAEITALDYSSDMLEQAKSRFKSMGINNVDFVQGNILQLPYENNYFDIVLSMNGFHVFNEKSKAFSEVSRVLHNGGVFIGCFYVMGENRKTDFVVNNFLSKKGWFNPPFYTKQQIESTLKKDYSSVEIQYRKSMVLFKCIK